MRLRRVGRNELAVIQAMSAIFDALESTVRTDAPGLSVVCSDRVYCTFGGSNSMRGVAR
jgi:hypothetical protein